MRNKFLKIAAGTLAALMLTAALPAAVFAATADPGIINPVPVNPGVPIPYNPTPVRPPVRPVPNPKPEHPISLTSPRVTTPFYFAKPGVATLIVTDAETGEVLPGVKYELYRVNEFGGKDTKYGTYTTNPQGKVTVHNAMTGSFYWVAAGAVEGYAEDTVKHEFRVIGTQFVTTEIALAKPVEEVAEEPAAEEPAVAEEGEEAAIAEIEEEILAPVLTEEAQAAFDKAIEGLLGVNYTPISCLAVVDVEETTVYYILCSAQIVVPDAEPYYAVVTVISDAEGAVLDSIVNTNELDENTPEVVTEGVVVYFASLVTETEEEPAPAAEGEIAEGEAVDTVPEAGE